MKIYNIHERCFPAPAREVGTLIDSLSGKDDVLWPRDRWPAMQFDAPLREGATGGHGPIKYSVFDYVPGERVVFQFGEKGLIGDLDGRHLFEVVPRRSHTLFRHIVDGEGNLKTWLKWKCMVGPLHDALMEDLLDGAEIRLTGNLKKPSRWSPWVRFLRRMIQKQGKKHT